jgi:hypothetical protein
VNDVGSPGGTLNVSAGGSAHDFTLSNGGAADDYGVTTATTVAGGLEIIYGGQPFIGGIPARAAETGSNFDSDMLKS